MKIRCEIDMNVLFFLIKQRIKFLKLKYNEEKIKLIFDYFEICCEDHDFSYSLLDLETLDNILINKIQFIYRKKGVYDYRKVEIWNNVEYSHANSKDSYKLVVWR